MKLTGALPPMHTVGLESIAMFGSFELVAVWCFIVWKSHLALQRESKVLLLGFLMEFSSYDLNQWFGDMPSLKWRYHCNAFQAFDIEHKITVRSGNTWL